ncbi:MAG: hypothetical protein V3W44_11010 [Dehalococcoidales bacterium]
MKYRVTAEFVFVKDGDVEEPDDGLVIAELVKRVLEHGAVWPYVFKGVVGLEVKD